MERRGRDGAQYMPVSVEEDSSDATARAWLVMRTEEASQVLLGPDQLAGERAALAVLKLERVHTSDVMLS